MVICFVLRATSINVMVSMINHWNDAFKREVSHLKIFLSRALFPKKLSTNFTGKTVVLSLYL
jgi:hypothetical protein